jgi:protein arginine kinase
MLHIPGLISTGIVGDLSRKLARAGFALRGADGEGSEPYADMVQISNQVTLGVTEKRTLQDMSRLAVSVASEERKARQQLYDRDRVGLEDKIGRAKGNMLFARRISSEEAMKGLSLLRLGRELELPGMPEYSTIQLLLASVGAGAIQQQAGRPLDGWERDEARADIIREYLNQEKT